MMKRTGNNFARRMRRGLTLLEALLALAITAMVGAVIVTLMNSTAMGTTGQMDGRRHLVRLQGVSSLLNDKLRSTRCILAAQDGALVLWPGDTRNGLIERNDAVNVSELVLLERDAEGRLLLYETKFPQPWSSADIISADAVYPGNTNWYAAAQGAKTSGYFVPTVIARNVTEFGVSLDAASPTAARLATLRITLVTEGVSRTVTVSLPVHDLLAPR